MHIILSMFICTTLFSSTEDVLTRSSTDVFEEETEAARIIAPLTSKLSYPYERAAWATNTKSGMLFAGAVGTRGGVDPYCLENSPHVLDPQWQEKILASLPSKHPYIKGVNNVLKKVEGKYKNQALKALRHLNSKQDISVLSLLTIALWGTKPEQLDPTTTTLFDHTIAWEYYMNLGMLGEYLDRESEFSAQYLRRIQNISDKTLLSGAANSSRPTITSYYAHKKREEGSMNLLFHFGGKFGLTAWIECFSMGRALCSVSTKPYKAHGVTMDVFSGPLHDAAHAQVMDTATRHLLSQVEQFLADAFYVKGGDSARFDTIHQEALPNEMKRFLSALGILNAGAFKYWVAERGDVSEYKKFATALFLLTHEFPGFNHNAILSTDFEHIMTTAIDSHLGYVRDNSASWESPTDVLQTSPQTGKSQLEGDDQTLINKILKRNKETVIKFLKQDRLEIPTDERNLAKWLSSTELSLSDGSLFYDLVVRTRSGEKLVFSEPTLRFKALNYEDTKGLLACAGITLPTIDENTTRDHVISAMQEGIDQWTGLMQHLKVQIAFLGEHIHNDQAETLKAWFLRTRLDSLQKLRDRLKNGVQPEFAIKHHYLPEEITKVTEWFFN